MAPSPTSDGLQPLRPKYVPLFAQSTDPDDDSTGEIEYDCDLSIRSPSVESRLARPNFVPLLHLGEDNDYDTDPHLDLSSYRSQPTRPSFVPLLLLEGDSEDESADGEMGKDSPLSSSRLFSPVERPPKPDFVPSLDLDQLNSDRRCDDKTKTGSSMENHKDTCNIDNPPRYAIADLTYDDIKTLLDAAAMHLVPVEYHDHFLRKLVDELNKKETPTEGEPEYESLHPVLINNLRQKFINDNLSANFEMQKTEMISVHEALESREAESVAKHFRMMERAILYKRQLERDVFNKKLIGTDAYCLYKEEELVDLPRGVRIGPKKTHSPLIPASPLCLYNYDGDRHDAGEEHPDKNDEVSSYKLENSAELGKDTMPRNNVSRFHLKTSQVIKKSKGNNTLRLKDKKSSTVSKKKKVRIRKPVAIGDRPPWKF